MKRPPELTSVLTFAVLAAIVFASVAASTTLGLLAGAAALLVPLAAWWVLLTARAHDLDRAREQARVTSAHRAPLVTRPDIPTTTAPASPAPWDASPRS